MTSILEEGAVKLLPCPFCGNPATAARRPVNGYAAALSLEQGETKR